jgi:hypothetical protein
VIKGMLTLNLVSFLTSNKVDFLDYDGWKKYMQRIPLSQLRLWRSLMIR